MKKHIPLTSCFSVGWLTTLERFNKHLKLFERQRRAVFLHCNNKSLLCIFYLCLRHLHVPCPIKKRYVLFLRSTFKLSNYSKVQRFRYLLQISV